MFGSTPKHKLTAGRSIALFAVGLAALVCASEGVPVPAGGLAAISIVYPAEATIFPPDIAAPAFIWRDAAPEVVAWRIEVRFEDGQPPLKAQTRGEPLDPGEIDARAVGSNEPPALAPEFHGARVWTPGESVWATIKQRSRESTAAATFTGFRDKGMRQAVSTGSVRFRTSKDPAGAPIFYRDVPLMPSELEKGVIKPLAAAAVPLIAWRLRDIGQPRSRVVLEGMHTCANCHSFSADGRFLGMDLDGPQNDKGLYAISAVAPRTVISNRDVISWLSFRGQPAGRMRVGFMSQISPDGRYVVTTVGAEPDLTRNYYVANFPDFRFLQVFYATRGILVVYDRVTGERRPLPGADDPRYVQTNAVWGHDGTYLIFARAPASNAYPEGTKMAAFANDPNETQVRYDLYRISFNGGRGGVAEPVAGASANGMSNSFPRVSPDGRWLVFVQARNGLLMRPDSRLFIVPAAGGTARLMRANTPLMNSWHSFSPNGRWMVFASKARSPYTQMYLTHISEDGSDSPPVLVENSTAANRAVNLPEFLNIRPGGLLKIEVPAAEFYKLFDRAYELGANKQYKAAVEAWRRALELNPGDAKANNNLAFALAQEGRMDEAIACWRKALEADRSYSDVYRNLSRALESTGRTAEAEATWRKALEIDPNDSGALKHLGVLLLGGGRSPEAVPLLERAAALLPQDPETRHNLGVALLRSGRPAAALPHLAIAAGNPEAGAQVFSDYGVALIGTGKAADAVAQFERALRADPKFTQAHLNLGNAFYLQGDPARALGHWRDAVRSDPANVSALTQTAWVLATHPDASLRDGTQAVALASRAAELTGGNDPVALDALAAAWAERQDFDKAVETAGRAAGAAAAQGNRAMANSIAGRVDSYRRRVPFRDKAAGR